MRCFRFVIACVVLHLATLPVIAEVPAAYAPVLARMEPVVSVEFVLNVKIEGAGAEQEIEGEIDCLLIDAEGMVLCSNTELGGYISLMGRMMGGGRQGLSVTGTPSDIKVAFGDATEGIEGRLVTRDTDRDLAWIQVDVPEGTDLPVHLDLAAATTLAAGDSFFALRRMDKFFGREPVVVEGTIGAVTQRPRALLVPARSLGLGFGLPIFDEAGTFVGVTVMQTPSLDEAQGLFSNPLSFLSSSARLGDMVGGVVLPAADLVKATRLAREILAEDEEELVEDEG